MLNFAVFGNPIAQSKSPFIHTMFGIEADIELNYNAILVDAHEFVSAASMFFAKPDHVGLNITAPFKEDAFKFADKLTPHAKAAGAVNTLYKTANGIVGHNTDGLGLMQDLLNQGVTLKQQNILLIGAGGAARGILVPLLEQEVAHIHIVNRNVKRAQSLLSIAPGSNITVSSFDDLPKQPYDVVINATTLSLQGNTPNIPEDVYAKASSVYDMVYLPQPTVFMQAALAAGCPNVSDGLGMLVGQAAESFTFWTGRKVDTGPVLEVLRQDLQGR